MLRRGQEEIEAVARVIRSGKLFRINDGLQEVEHFEKELAAKYKVQYALCLNGGTAALAASLIGLGIGPGDEVIVPAYTFIATAMAVLSVGAIPVIADVDETATIDLDDVEEKLRPAVKAVIPVDMVGLPCNMKRLMAMSRTHGFSVVEDSCQAVGGHFAGRRLGSWGHAGCLSFNDYKIMSSGEGGALLTNDRTLYERALLFQNGGSGFQYYTGPVQSPEFVGFQCRASEMTGAILRVQLKRLDGIIDDLKTRKNKLVSELSDAPGIRLMPSHDPDGDCGLTLGLVFDQADQAVRFVELSAIGASRPVDSIRHVYNTWDAILEKRGSHHPALNPFNMPQNQGLRMDYHPDMCPRSLDALARLVFITISLDWTDEDIRDIARKCRTALAGCNR